MNAHVLAWASLFLLSGCLAIPEWQIEFVPTLLVFNQFKNSLGQGLTKNFYENTI